MNTNIEIKIECKGNSVGTLNWFNSLIEKSGLVIKECQSGSAGMFLKEPTSDGKFKYSFICKAVSDYDLCNYNVVTDDKIAFTYPVCNRYESGLFDFALTPACEKKVGEFISLAIEKYREWWNEN